MAQQLTNRYIWLVETIHNAGRLSLAEINDKWKNSSIYDGKEISRRTFLNHKNAVEELFDINIECDLHDDYKYYIENVSDLEKPSIRNWIISAMSLQNQTEGNKKIRKRILLEDIPSGKDFLQAIIEAMKKEVVIRVGYRTYDTDADLKFHTLEPYGLKMAQRRWYLIAHSLRSDVIATFALDRMHSVDLLDKKFKMPENMKIESLFNDYYGVMRKGLDGDNVEKVKIKVYGVQRNYLRDLPLHSSQKETKAADDSSVFTYDIVPSYDFVQAVLAMGPQAEVLRPTWLRKHIAKTVKDLAKLYKK